MAAGRRRPGALFRTVRSRRIATAVLVVAGAALAGYLASLLVYPAPLVPQEARVPLVIGLPEENATRELERLGFRVKTGAAREQDPTLPAGYVTWQDPPGAVELPEGSQVELTLSDGPAPVTVPDVLQFDSDQAARVLTAAGLMVGTVDSVPSRSEAGIVVATRPPAGTARPPGSRIDVVVSRGPAAIRVPDLVGAAEAEARSRLEELGLRVGLVRMVRDARAPAGTVTAQSPRPGALSARGGRVDLTVADPRGR